MRRTTLNFTVEVVTFLAAIGMVLTGLVIRWVLPPSSGSRRSLWSLTRHEWGDVHFWIAVGLIALTVVHIALHWNWVCAVLGQWMGRHKPLLTRADRIRHNAVGVVVLAVIFAGFAAFVWIGKSDVVEHAGSDRGPGNSRASIPSAELDPTSPGP